MTNSIKVNLAGMSDKNHATFTYFVKKNMSKKAQLSAIDTAEVLILDYDTMQGKKIWKQYHESRDLHVILLASEDPKEGNATWVYKPVRPSDLKNAIIKAKTSLVSGVRKEDVCKKDTAKSKVITTKTEKTPSGNPPEVKSYTKRDMGYSRDIKQEMGAELGLNKSEIIECCGSEDDIEFSSLNFRKRFVYESENTLLKPFKEALNIAKERKVYVEIDLLKTKLIVFPNAKQVYYDDSHRVVRHLCAMPLQNAIRLKQTSTFHPGGKYNGKVKKKDLHSAESILWNITMWTSRGRLPDALEADQILKMSQWPNFTRLQQTPYAIQIAALWNRRAMSPLAMAQYLNIPMRYVFSLAAAAHSAELLTNNEKHEGEDQAPEWKRPQGIFASILRTISRAA